MTIHASTYDKYFGRKSFAIGSKVYCTGVPSSLTHKRIVLRHLNGRQIAPRATHSAPQIDNNRACSNLVVYRFVLFLFYVTCYCGIIALITQAAFVNLQFPLSYRWAQESKRLYGLPFIAYWSNKMDVTSCQGCSHQLDNAVLHSGYTVWNSLPAALRDSSMPPNTLKRKLYFQKMMNIMVNTEVCARALQLSS